MPLKNRAAAKKARKSPGKQKSAGPSPAPRESRNGASPMYTERLRKLYSNVLKGRMIAEKSPTLRGLPYSFQGWEAAAAGLAIHLSPDDLVAPSPWEAVLDSLRGVPLSQILSAHRTTPAGTGPAPAGLSMRSATQLAIGSGMAFAAKAQHRFAVTVALVGDDVEPQSWREAMRFSSSRKLAVVYCICGSSNAALSRSLDFCADARACDVPAIIVDGNDAVAVYRVAEETVRRARQDLGPSLIECRLERHRDSLAFMEDYLRRRNLWSEEWARNQAEDFRKELQEALRA
ncbi:MAG TPA: thiamine pyrophosphate-dependent enzyme [Candidatus Limnocylindrales bacterium]|nr:thiamine pyrophosphate-dependent enzyme [Candidatus Limnocylindrales bacterium]